MRIYGFLLIMLFSGSLMSAQALAQGGRANPNRMVNALEEKFTKSYADAVEKIYSSANFGGYTLLNIRGYYPRTEQFQVFSDKITDEMIKLSYAVENEKDVVKAQESAKAFDDLVKLHFANLEILFLAASLSEKNVRLGDHNFYAKARDEMYKIMTTATDGSSMQLAIKINTFGEEEIILRRAHLGKLIKSNLYDNGGSFLNIHEFKSAKTGKMKKLFVDLTVPIAASEKIKKEQDALKKRFK